MTFRELVREGREVLKAAGVPAFDFEARELMLRAEKIGLTGYINMENDPAPPLTRERYRSSCARRAAGEPLQYITGEAPFYGRDFAVRPGVLIPRFDTETLVEGVLHRLSAGNRILDLCTGSGCILLTLLLEGPRSLTGVGSDISPRALEVAEENAGRYADAVAEKGSAAAFVKSDLWSAITGTYDIICSNPPYIRRDEVDSLDMEVAGYEPRLALDGGEDGLDFYRAITRRAPDYLRRGGTLALEIGYDEADAVKELLIGNGFAEIEILCDLSGRTRAAIGVKYD